MMLKPMQTRHPDNERIKREHQLGQRIAQEREYWRRFVADLIVEERERLVEALNQKLFDGEALASIEDCEGGSRPGCSIGSTPSSASRIASLPLRCAVLKTTIHRYRNIDDRQWQSG
jgi:hypothetical protein